MFAGFIIAFRESLEASLVVGIVLSYLKRTKQTVYNNVVYIGVAAGIAASIVGAFLFQKIAGGFTGRTEEIFEGVTMLVGAALLTTMIFWMLKRSKVAAEIEKKVATKIETGKSFELFLLVFVAILREGIETVIFLNAALALSSYGTLTGALIGLVTAIILGYAIFVAAKKINLKKFFEAGLIPVVAEHIWDINPEVVEDGVYPLLHEKGHIGSIFKGLFGYNGNPNLLEIVGYFVYLLFIGIVWKRIKKY